tara:strand:- start:469 stop:1011 length:543 start_codon:yes stop_codon:yes gene_type:complete
MKTSKFKIHFSYSLVEAPFALVKTGEGKLPKLLTATKCTIETVTEGIHLASSVVVPFHATADNRLYARKKAFSRAVNTEIEIAGVVTKLFPRAERRALWNDFRSVFTQPESGRIRLRNIEGLLKKIPGVTTNNYEEMSNAIRGILRGAKLLQTLDCATTSERVQQMVPNAEPLEAVSEAS